mgnify:CR=1 FL=1
MRTNQGYSKIIVVPYDEKWTENFNAIKSEIEKALGDLIIGIEHVGSTSVVGLSAKPIIDLDVIIPDYSFLDQVINKLNEIGYKYKGDLGVKEREAFFYEGKPHLQNHNLYVCPQNSRELKRHITFRNYLRDHPDAVKKYSEIKMEGSKLYPYDIDKYLDHKSAFIHDIYVKCNLEK